jgi:hypothetical protein
MTKTRELIRDIPKQDGFFALSDDELRKPSVEGNLVEFVDFDKADVWAHLSLTANKKIWKNSKGEIFKIERFNHLSNVWSWE